MAKKKAAEKEVATPLAAPVSKSGKTAEASPDKENDWMAEEDFRTLLKAHEIQEDEERMAKIHNKVGRHKKAISSIEGLKKVYNEKFGK